MQGEGSDKVKCQSPNVSFVELEAAVSRNEGNVLFNGALSMFCLRLYGVGHVVKDQSGSQRRNLMLPPLHGLLFPVGFNMQIQSKLL